ncbi:MAG: hypothetical protein ACN4GZ_10265 [Acidimicrobiales bacterium]
MSPSDQPIATETFVELDGGVWHVDIVVVFSDEAVRRRVNTYRTRREAEIAATWIRRAADRDIEGPVHG